MNLILIIAVFFILTFDSVATAGSVQISEQVCEPAKMLLSSCMTADTIERDHLGGSDSGGGVFTSPKYAMNAEGILYWIEIIKRPPVKPNVPGKLSMASLCKWCHYNPRFPVCQKIKCVLL